MVKSIRLDVAPLIRYIQEDTSYKELVSRDVVRHWKRVGTIDLYRADAWCVKLGIHPIEIWGSGFYTSMEDNENG
jgi:hypothetical protein